MKKFIIVSIILLIIGCSNDQTSVDQENISNNVLSGKVFGADFVAKGGKAFDSGDKISVNITNTTADCKSSVFDFEYKVSIYIENKTGINKEANVIFMKKGEFPLNVLQSTVIVESVTETQIIVRIKSSSKKDNTVEGKFTVPYCK